MPKRRRQSTVDRLISRIDRQLDTFGKSRSGLSLREKVKCLVDIQEKFKELGISVVAESGLTSRAARERIRLYLIEYVGNVIEGAELAVVAGISDYPRRIRELRHEQGYQVASGASPDPDTGIDLKPDQYLLVTPHPDKDAARRWHVANRIRRGPGGSQHRILSFLTENVGKIITTEELAYVARDAREFARRIRELRTEQGYPIATRFTGRPDLSVGQYVLQSTERVAESHDRHIPEEIQKAVYRRDNNTCRLCGWNMHRWSASDPRILELHHMQQHQHGGSNDERNLVVLCGKCHDEVHAGKHADGLAKVEKSLWRTSSQ